MSVFDSRNDLSPALPRGNLTPPASEAWRAIVCRSQVHGLRAPALIPTLFMYLLFKFTFHKLWANKTNHPQNPQLLLLQSVGIQN